VTEILIVLSVGSDRLEIEPSSESAFLANNASSSRSAVMALFRRPAGGPQIQGAPLLRGKNPLSTARPSRLALPRSRCTRGQFALSWGRICPRTSDSRRLNDSEKERAGVRFRCFTSGAEKLGRTPA
jgi:hypothetical protein